ncbi:heat shock 70 kDa protein II-like [Aphidius gifuensis]|uniref:heat shock 70 kDa protein II-like n=1 Tax=Aphidius gifuensis TaxID=684658 RepID=UPI001CDD7481|nr:heat shock 70 kDa protein II-like [Aphidius gifuensis]
MSGHAIGIDLGTTYSCVAVWQGGKVHIIPNAQGMKTTPSYVAFKGNERLIGEAAKNQAALNSSNTVFDAKRLIGRKFDEEQVQLDIKQWPFKVVSDGVENNPKIQVEFCGEVKEFNPEEISSMVLEKMKEIAEAFLNEKVKDAVITVPAYFNNSQRNATKVAGEIAGLNVLRIINEPTAAALAYGLDKNLKGQKNVLIFDLGGGTIDVSILSITEGLDFEVKSTTGDIHLGGEDFDSILVDHLCEKFKAKSGNDVKKNMKALKRLRTAAVRAKHDLSLSTEADIIVEALVDGIDFETKISRVEFEELCAELFIKALEPVERALAGAETDKIDIDDVVLVGGSTRIPKIQSMLQNFFNGKKLNFSINPDEAVAYGAAVQAAMLSEEGKKSEILQAVRLVDVTPLSLGISVSIDDLMSIIIKKNTKIPCKSTERFVTSCDNQEVTKICIFEGERKFVKDNNFLGKFRLIGITPAPAGTEAVDVIFEIDVNGILHVTATGVKSDCENNITIVNNEKRWSKKKVDEMIADAEKFRSYDENQGNMLKVKHSLESYVRLTKQAIYDSTSSLTEDEKKQIYNICSNTWMWVKENQFDEAEPYHEKLQEMERVIMSIMSRKERETASAKNQLYKYIKSMENGVNQHRSKLSQNDQDRINEMCEDARMFLKANSLNKDHYIEFLRKMKKECDSIINKPPSIITRMWNAFF